jgi:hypothetical protein
MLLGAFTRLRKAIISSVMSVCSSIHNEQLASHWTDFHEIWYLSIFRESVEKIQVSLKPDKNNWYFTWRPAHIFYHISRISSENEKWFWHVVQKNKTHILYSLTFFEKSAFHEIMWKNMIQPYRSQMTGYKHILRISNTYCFSTETMIAWTRLNLKLYVHCLFHSVMSLRNSEINIKSVICREDFTARLQSLHCICLQVLVKWCVWIVINMAFRINDVNTHSFLNMHLLCFIS